MWNIVALIALSLLAPMPLISQAAEPSPRPEQAGWLKLLLGTATLDQDEAEPVGIGGLEYSWSAQSQPWMEGHLRQQLSLIRYQDTGLEGWSVEWNPHVLYFWAPDRAVEVGPGAALLRVERQNVEDYLLGLQFGVGLNFFQGTWLWGVEVRYQFTSETDLALSNLSDFNNTHALLKLAWRLP